MYFDITVSKESKRKIYFVQKPETIDSTIIDDHTLQTKMKRTLSHRYVNTKQKKKAQLIETRQSTKIPTIQRTAR